MCKYIETRGGCVEQLMSSSEDAMGPSVVTDLTGEILKWSAASWDIIVEPTSPIPVGVSAEELVFPSGWTISNAEALKAPSCDVSGIPGGGTTVSMMRT